MALGKGVSQQLAFCLRGAVVYGEKASAGVKALKTLAAGEELTICYVDEAASVGGEQAACHYLHRITLTST
eukprot:SAG11_NODE_5178_length_1639_cov_0.934416_3_plen_71_part_00